MGKDKKSKKETAQVVESAQPTAFDPTLAALFASSAGPILAPPKPTRNTALKTTKVARSNGTSRVAEIQAGTGSSSADEVSSDAVGGSDSSPEPGAEVEVEQNDARPRKRRKVDQHDDLESEYLDKLVREEEQEQKQKINEQKAEDSNAEEDEEDLEVSDSDLNSELEDLSNSDAEVSTKVYEDIPKHESLEQKRPDVEADKVNRTVFLGNVSISAIKSKSAKKAVILHLRTVLDEKDGEKIESIRFRSTAFVSDAGPKRAAYAKKELMEETMKSTNAYVVFSTEAAARKAALRLNGTTVLDRHLRVDIVGQPARVDHKRCVFVGNLSFVDEATATEDVEGEEKKRKRAREPADAEEGLWRVFGKAGKVENVRVVRDKETRISKGFAYVQFEGENAVEAALLMNERKFPPLLPRPMRVMRAKKDMSRKRGTSGSGKGEKFEKFRRTESRPQGRRPRRNDDGSKIVFEGHRASSGTSNDVKTVKKRSAVKPTNRSSKRGAVFKAGGKKKKRDL